MTYMRKLAAGAAFTALLCGAASAVHAQEITGAIAGTVTSGAGAPVGGAQVKVTNTSSGQTLNAVTDSHGFYTIRNLSVGGPYRIAVSSASGAKTITIPQIGIGQAYNLNIALPAGGDVTEVVVTAASARVAGAMVQTGPRSTFTAADIAASPSFAGDLKDLTRMNPLVTIDLANSNAVIVAGANSHLNTIYVDGVRQSDDFGLNANGYPTQRSPFPVDAVKAFNFEVAPYDVRYGNFQGGILNVVTKSGTNDFHGSASYATDSNRISGRKIGYEALKIAGPDRKVSNVFHDEAYSVTLGGPIIKDKLFLFGAYEKYNGIGSSGNFVPGDVAGANPIFTVTSANVTAVQNILKTKYGYDPLNYGGSGPVTDEKKFIKADWYITDTQHLFASYQSTKGSIYSVPNGSVANKILNLQSNDYGLEQDLRAYTVDLVSHWTDNLTTELEYSNKKVVSPTVLETGPFSEFKVQFPSTGSIFLGPDISRQANDLSNIDKQYKARADYTWGSNVTTIGYEHEDLSVSDLFVQNATGTYTFSTGCGPGMAIPGFAGDVLLNLQAGVACNLVYANAFDNNPASAGSTAKSTTDTGFIQDEWRVTPALTVRAGLRYERFGSGTAPKLNPRFLTQYGYPNNLTVKDQGILMPRFGFNWQPDPTFVLSGGAGLFSGGNPIVYTYNSYTNSGNVTGSRTYTCNTPTCPAALTGVLGSSIPANVQADITTSANLGTGAANALAPNFKPPSVWKATLSAVKTINFDDYGFMGPAGSFLGDNWRIHGDAYYARTKQAVLFQDIWELQNVTGTAPDGRPTYNPARYTNPLNRTSGQDILLANTTKGNAKIWALGFGKDFANGFSFDYTYTHQRVRDVSAATSSTASSNYNNTISADPNNPALATSNYEIRFENRLTVGWEHKFFGDNKTTVKLFGFERAGLPFSYSFCTTSSSSCVSPSNTAPAEGLFGQAQTSTNHELLYVPAGANGIVTASSDPRVTFGPGFDLAAFNSYLQTTGLAKYEGQIAPRNAFRSRNVAEFDLHLAQEFPAYFLPEAKGEVFFDVINLGNLINKNWGIINQVGFPYTQAPVVARNCQTATGAGTGATQCVAGKGNFYQYDAFKPTTGATSVQTQISPPVATWVLKMGVRFKF
jgi:hypothetical protein